MSARKKTEPSTVVGVLRASPTATGEKCAGCRADIVWAADDARPSQGNLYNSEPDPAGTKPGAMTAVLWYQVTAQGKPIGAQLARIIGPATSWEGPTWSPHGCQRFTITATKGAADAKKD